MSTNTGPSEIFIIRHGEKLGDPKKEDDGGRHLSVQGSARAADLPSLFAPPLGLFSCGLRPKADEFHGHYHHVPIKSKPARFATPDFIFATARSKHSKRPMETVTPLATALDVPINDGFDDTEIKKLANAILTELAFAGKIVLVCWHHGKIPDIAKALGVKRPPKWDAKVFDRVWQITYPKGKASLLDLPQMLLYGDSKK
jgi:hypothetical protein